MREDELDWLESWLAQQADGEWEHSYGIRIESLDNPGWAVSIDLEGTPLATKPFGMVHIAKGERDWLTCSVREGKFEGFGDPSKLRVILGLFQAWS
jgi:hypothetical protein